MGSDTDRMAIHALAQGLEDAWNRHDAAAFAAGFAADADFTNVFGMRARGRAAIEAFHAPIFRTMFKDSTLAIGEIGVRFVRSDVAAVDISWRMTGARDPQGNDWPERHGLISAVATRETDGWRFAVFHNQDLPPPERLAEIAAGVKG